jgi:hypothetical protein
MNNLSVRNFFLFALFFSFTINFCSAQIFHKNVSRKIEKELFGKSPGNKKEIKVRESRSVRNANKKKEVNKEKLRSAKAKSVILSQKRTFDIQTAEVQKRMKKDKKNTATRDKAKLKKVKTNSRKAGKKFK